MSTRSFACVGAVLLVACSHGGSYEPDVPNGDAERGRQAIAALECGACHIVPGVPGAWGRVGPTLAGFRSSVYIAGQYPNVPDVLVRFVRDAPSLAPDTAMPAIEMSEAEARDIAAYLYSLE